MKRLVVTCAVALSLLVSGCDAIRDFFGVDDPILFTRYIRNEYSESIFTISVSVGEEPVQSAMDERRIGAYQSAIYQFRAYGREPTTVVIEATSLGTKRVFSVAFAEALDVSHTMVYRWDSATGGFVVFY